ncbi:hypothetical protein FHW84_002813 [Dyella sp. SG562]|uniref:hypothetical protein n=1 Tax=Dyella sp. SG562 TaxID=2587017 RepID=UPI001423E7EE|nr:hypothetical protein [Dyella sp. SG562]NII74228.1 hypothetical protein [Dyella sp. SG562]
MHLTCPSCSDSFPIAAGFLEPDGKRFGMQLAGMEPALGRAVIEYLALFSPAKQRLRLSKAVRLVAELDALVKEGSVCRDDRAGMRRPCSTSQWVNGIEQMLEKRSALTLPLANHNYLRSVVFGLAEQAGAQAEIRREADARAGRPPSRGTGVSPPQPREDPLQNELAYLDQLHSYGQLSDAEYDEKRAAAYLKFGGDRERSD